jgi:hypothetical protein
VAVYELDVSGLRDREAELLFDLGRVVRALVRDGYALQVIGGYADAELRRHHRVVRRPSIPVMAEYLAHVALAESLAAGREAAGEG